MRGGGRGEGRGGGRGRQGRDKGWGDRVREGGERRELVEVTRSVRGG